MSLPQNENSGGLQGPVFDPTRLEMLMQMEEEGDDSMVKDIAAQFLEDVTGVMARIETAIGSNDLPQISAAAHTIKGSAATFGLYRVEKIAKQLETCAKNGSKDEIPGLYAVLGEEFTAGRAALNAYFEGK